MGNFSPPYLHQLGGPPFPNLISPILGEQQWKKKNPSEFFGVPPEPKLYLVGGGKGILGGPKKTNKEH